MRRFSEAPVCLAAALLLVAPLLAHGQAYAYGAIALNGISASSLAGSVDWSGAWTLGAISSANNSLGEISANYDFGESSVALASSTVTYANGYGYAAYNYGLGPPTGLPFAYAGVQGEVNLPPGNLSAAVGSFGNNVTLETTFSINGASETDVTFAAALGLLLQGNTGPDGQVLHDETIFNMEIDNSNVMSLDVNLTTGPNRSFDEGGGGSPLLTDTLDLSTGPHDLFIEMDSEQEGVVSTPDAPSPWVWMEVGGFLFALHRRWSRQKSS